MRTFENESLGIISSQAPQECGEGSTIRVDGPERTMELHERATAEYQRQYRIDNLERLTAYKKQHYRTNRESILAKQREYVQPRKEHIAKRSKEWRENNKARLDEAKKKYYLENRERILAQKRIYTQKVSKQVIARRRAKRATSLIEMAKHNYNGSVRRAAEVCATPKWADERAIKAFYIAAQFLSTETGIKHSVDHIYPLRGATVCGLHVEDNLRVVAHAENCSKQNSFPADDMI